LEKHWAKEHKLFNPQPVCLLSQFKILRRKFMKKYTCTICGYTYDPAAGDSDNDVAPGTAWEDVNEDWPCPDCGAEKDMFEED
jgi:rubredoxin